MKNGYVDGVIKSNKEISPNIYEIVLEGQFNGKAGQFFMLRGWNGMDPLLPRPISIARLTSSNITFLYEVKGRGTHIISQLKSGGKLSIFGPLGNGFELVEKKRIAIVGGGIGIAPLIYLADSFKGENVDFYAGYRNSPYYIDEITEKVDNVYISTEDGSHGHKGYIVDILNPSSYDVIYTCGPVPMMESVLNKSRNEAKVYVSMETRMACGIGACLGCNVNTINGIERACKEGPVFIGEEVIFDA